jgi:putative tryptophan/tyrosine transport system substrate-binding protein
MHEVEATARALGLEVSTPEIRRAEDIAPAFQRLKGQAEALSIVTDPLMVTNRLQINTLARDARLPTICPAREYAESRVP